MAPSDLIDRIEETGQARPVLRPHRGERGLCGAYFARLLELYAADPPRAARLASQWRAFLDLGDDPALAYRAKGASDRFGGRWLASADAFVRAGELAGDDVSRHAYSLGAIDGLAKAGRIKEAVAMGVRLAKGLDALGEDALAARARLNTANALLWADQGEDAREHLERAIPAFRREGMAVEEASARLSLSSTHLYGGDPAVAAREATESQAIADRAGLAYVSALGRFNLASVALVQGRVDEAFAQLVALREPLEDSPDAVRLETAIGDACLRLNLLDEAEEAYTAALASRDGISATDRAYLLFGLGETKAASDPAAADLLYAKASHRWRNLGNRAWQSAALAARVGLRPEARSAIRLARKALESAEGSPYHETLALLALAEALIAHGRDAQEPLDRAATLVRRFGYRRFAWRIHALRARAADSPLPHYRRMVAEILRERLTVTSTAARAGFLKDKSRALGDYLTTLLDSPTPKRVEEVVETVRQTRAVTLLDEILRSGSARLSPEQERRLEALRLEVAEEIGPGGLPDARSSEGRVPRKRGWTEATHDLGALDAVVPPKVVDGCVVFVEAGGGIWAVVGERSTRLPLGTAELEEALRWLKYELQAVTADRDAPSQEALSLLRELRAGLVEPWLPLVGDGPLRICPDGLLWRVPWDAVVDGPSTATLLLHPSLSGGGTVEALDQVAIWIDAGERPAALRGGGAGRPDPLPARDGDADAQGGHGVDGKVLGPYPRHRPRAAQRGQPHVLRPGVSRRPALRLGHRAQRPPGEPGVPLGVRNRRALDGVERGAGRSGARLPGARGADRSCEYLAPRRRGRVQILR